MADSRPRLDPMGFGPDDLLYHYTTREAALNFILPTGRIRFNLMRDMNDPREAKRWIIFPRRDINAPGLPEKREEAVRVQRPRVRADAGNNEDPLVHERCTRRRPLLRLRARMVTLPNVDPLRRSAGWYLPRL
jgi:hypothetical protein